MPSTQLKNAIVLLKNDMKLREQFLAEQGAMHALQISEHERQALLQVFKKGTKNEPMTYWY